MGVHLPTSASLVLQQTIEHLRLILNHPRRDTRWAKDRSVASASFGDPAWFGTSGSSRASEWHFKIRISNVGLGMKSPYPRFQNEFKLNVSMKGLDCTTMWNINSYSIGLNSSANSTKPTRGLGKGHCLPDRWVQFSDLIGELLKHIWRCWL